MRTPFLLLLFLFIPGVAHLQATNYTAYTVNDGLPSNHVYQCLEDDHGFLWIATDAGIARFDGKYFQVFTMEQGLPDNEVLELAKDKDGVIWINCFRQGPAYFDEFQNRFIVVAENSGLAMESGTTGMTIQIFKDGSISYVNENGSFLTNNKQLIHFPLALVRMNKDRSVLQWKYTVKQPAKDRTGYIIHLDNNKAVDSIGFPKGLITVPPSVFMSGENVYVVDKANTRCYILSGIETNPLRYKIDSVIFPERFFFSGFTKEGFYIITNSAKIYLYSKKDHLLQQIVSGDYIPNGIYKDSKENTWVSTVDKGLLVYRKNQLTNNILPADFTHTNFLSITRTPDRRILAGNYYGEVLEISKQGTIIHQTINKIPSRQRKVIVHGSDIYTFSEDGVVLNYNKRLMNITGLPSSGKTGMVYDDSTLLGGTAGGIFVINTYQKNIIASKKYKRITAMAKAVNGIVYLGSTNGLHLYNVTENKFYALTNLVNERITALHVTPDGLLWAATSGNGIRIFKNEKQFGSISVKSGLISNSCRSMTSGRKNQVWLGTSQGISIITYDQQNNQLNFSIKNLSINDGLSSNEINEMCFSNDTIYAATGNGISMIPAGLSMPSFNIPVHLIGITINQHDTLISNLYKLGSEQRNIQMLFAAIEMNGHFKHLEYTLNGENWLPLNGRSLTLQLSHGRHAVQVRAVDVHGHISNKTFTIRFDIATPFWKSIWFWILIGLALQIVALYFILRFQKARKEAKLTREIAIVQTASLEQQAFTSLMNPHFIFNALNSIQHYINVQDRQKANRYLSDFASLIRKNFEASQQSFISLEQELENIRIYLRLEQMRFADRFSYEIIMDENVDPEKWMIPTMMLQPLLENALLHGIMPSRIKGKLEICLVEHAESLLVSITDNGIGLKQSLASKPSNGHKSHGMELIRKRIKSLGILAGESITIEMAPAFEDTQNPGNKTLLNIPHSLYNTWLTATSTRFNNKHGG